VGLLRRIAKWFIPITVVGSKQKSMMRFRSLSLALAVVSLLVACSTPDSRITANRAAFEKFPAETQAKIRAGHIDLGFTPEMVRLALGEPARRLSRQSEAGEVELWIYRDDGPHLSLGVGVGSSGYHSGVGGGVAVSTGGYDADERMRVEFRAGLVSAIEYTRK
jgi:hypothetical protein